MRPLDDKQRRKSAGVARARVCLKTHLDWLDGFPVSQSHGQLKWMLRPRIGMRDVRTVTIDRDTLRRATIAVSRLSTELVSSTRTIVGDVKEWQECVLSLLESLKTVIHQSEDRLTDIPVEYLSDTDLWTVTRLKRQFPELHEFLKAIVWSHWTQREKRSLLLSWTFDNAAALAAYVKSIDWPSNGSALLLFADLVQTNDNDDLRILQQILFEARTFDITKARYRHEADNFIDALKKWHDPQEVPTIPALSESDFHPAFVHFLNWLTDQEPLERRIAVRMLGLVMNLPALQRWRDAWQQFDHSARATVRSLQSLAKRLPKAEFHVEACRMAEELSWLLSESGPIVVTAELLNAVRSVVATHSVRFCE
ncbi:MAG: hypothetical protein H7Z17_03700, partial [Fuerstia sp.]|nr:hypothetical protein [Fuerstiella sp.]